MHYNALLYFSKNFSNFSKKFKVDYENRENFFLEIMAKNAIKVTDLCRGGRCTFFIKMCKFWKFSKVWVKISDSWKTLIVWYKSPKSHNFSKNWQIFRKFLQNYLQIFWKIFLMFLKNGWWAQNLRHLDQTLWKCASRSEVRITSS